MVDSDSNVVDTLSERSLGWLSNHGWNPDNSVDAGNQLAELSTNGFVANDIARQVLETFGGFTFDLPQGGIGRMSFSVTEARHTFKPEYTPLLGELIGEENPCPVGGGGGYILFMCPSGRLALLQEQWFYLLLADSLGDMFEAIIFNDRSRCHEVPNVEDCCPDW